MKSRGLHEVESDCYKTFIRLRLYFDGPEANSNTWLTVSRLAEKLAEEAGRAHNRAKMEETLASVRAMNPAGLPES